MKGTARYLATIPLSGRSAYDLGSHANKNGLQPLPFRFADVGYHVTVQSIVATLQDEPRVVDAFRSVDFRRFALWSNELDMFDNNCLVLRLSRPGQLVELHEDLIREWLPLHRPNTARKIVPRDARARDLHHRYGSQYSLERYTPHVTLEYDYSGDFDQLDTPNIAFSAGEMQLWRYDKEIDLWTLGASNSAVD